MIVELTTTVTTVTATIRISTDLTVVYADPPTEAIAAPRNPWQRALTPEPQRTIDTVL